jgi:hypothetical protein
MAPAGGDEILRDSMGVVSKATGLQFVVEGSTDEPPSSSRPPVLSRYGNRWAPVLVAWTDDVTVPRLAGHTVGLGGPSGASYSSDADKHWVSGIVYLDSPDLKRVMSQPNGRAIARSIVMHEFGHLVGLDHVNDPSQIMYPSTTEQVAFGPGDLEGLRRLGNGPCFS